MDCDAPGCGSRAIIIELPSVTGSAIALLPSPASPASAVHIWRLRLDPDTSTVAMLGRSLSADEHDRAERCRHPDDVRRFRVARGALRALIARYLETDPAAIQFEYGPHGKPALARDSAVIDLQFNLSHSGDVALVAFCVGCPLGVDLEHAERSVDALALAGRYGSPRECAMLQALDAGQRPRRFIELWTCKEAWLKAAGLGIGAGLAALEIELGTGRPCISRLPSAGGDIDHWSIALLEPEDGFVAAIVLHDPVHELGEMVERGVATVAAALVGEHMTIAIQPRPVARWAPL